MTATHDARSLIPSRAGEVYTFLALGRGFRIKRHGRTTYSLFQDGLTERSRWGTLPQIAEDLAHVLEYGTLPPPSGPRW